MFKKIIAATSPYLLFLPFLILYIIFIKIEFSIIDVGDEGRFLFYVDNILKGSYSSPAPDIELLSGPGYPLLIAPLVALGFSKLYIVLLNALFLYLSIVFLFKTLVQLAPFNTSILFAFCWGCYYIAYKHLPQISYEVFSIFLITLLSYTLVTAFIKKPQSKAYLLLPGFIFGYLILTKVIFGYVILVLMAGTILLWIVNRKKINIQKTMIVLIVAFLTFLPYLIYTYNLTNRIYYLGTGSENLYWMTSPYKDEYGDWQGPLDQNPLEYSNYNIIGAGDTLKARHGKDYKEIYSSLGLERDDALKRISINNIKNHPTKFLLNIVYNTSRLFFHYPFSYARQKPKTALVFPLNSIIFTLIILALFPTIINWKKIVFPLRLLIIICFIYLGGGLIGSVESRMLAVIVPILILWFAYIFTKSVTIKLKDW